MLATFLLVPGFQTSVIALATLWAPSVQKLDFYKKEKSLENRGRKVIKNGGRVQRELAVCFLFVFRPIRLLFVAFTQLWALQNQVTCCRHLRLSFRDPQFFRGNFFCGMLAIFSCSIVFNFFGYFYNASGTIG